VLIDHCGALAAADVGRDQLTFDRGGRQALVPQGDGKIGEARKVAGKGARRLRARTLRSIHVDRQAEHETDRATLGGKPQKPRRVGGKTRALDGLDAGRKPPVRIADRNANGLGAEIEADQRAARAKMARRFDKRENESDHRRPLGNGFNRALYTWSLFVQQTGPQVLSADALTSRKGKVNQRLTSRGCEFFLIIQQKGLQGFEAVMMQNPGVPTATARPGEDFEWVNSWADASGLKAAQEFAAEPIKPMALSAKPAAAPAPVTRGTVFPVASDQLARDIGEIEHARDAIIAGERAGAYALPAPLGRTTATGGLLRRQDAVPVLIGAMLAMFMLVVYGAVASILALGR
jgi:hypothetical protein